MDLPGGFGKLSVLGKTKVQVLGEWDRENTAHVIFHS